MDTAAQDPAAVTWQLDVGSRVCVADLALIFGTRLHDPVPIAASLFHRGFVPLIAVTGRSRVVPDLVEAHRHRDALVDAGVPPDAIVVEAESRTTLDNVRMLTPLLERRGVVPRSVIVVAKWWHRRALLHPAALWPQLRRLYGATYEPTMDGVRIGRDDWHRTDAGRTRIVRELDSIRTWWHAGNMREVARTADGWRPAAPDR